MWLYRDYAEAQEGIVEGSRASIITWKPTSASASSQVPSREYQARSITLEYRSVDVRKMTPDIHQGGPAEAVGHDLRLWRAHGVQGTDSMQLDEISCVGQGLDLELLNSKVSDW